MIQATPKTANPFPISEQHWYRTHDLFVWCRCKTAEANWIEAYLFNRSTFEPGPIELGGYLLVRGDAFLDAVREYNNEQALQRCRSTVLAGSGGLF